MSLTIQQIINIARISQFLSQVDIAKGVMYGQRITPLTPRILYMERKALEWMYNLDPTNSTLPLVGNYVYSLCRGYNLEAQGITGGGGSIAPITPTTPIKSPIRITSNDFASATEWDGVNSDGIEIQATYTLQVFANFIARYLEEGVEWERTLTGINILLPGFDAQTMDYEFYIDISA